MSTWDAAQADGAGGRADRHGDDDGPIAWEAVPFGGLSRILSSIADRPDGRPDDWSHGAERQGPGEDAGGLGLRERARLLDTVATDGSSAQEIRGVVGDVLDETAFERDLDGLALSFGRWGDEVVFRREVAEAIVEGWMPDAGGPEKAGAVERIQAVLSTHEGRGFLRDAQAGGEDVLDGALRGLTRDDALEEQAIRDGAGEALLDRVEALEARQTAREARDGRVDGGTQGRREALARALDLDPEAALGVFERRGVTLGHLLRGMDVESRALAYEALGDGVLSRGTTRDVLSMLFKTDGLVEGTDGRSSTGDAAAERVMRMGLSKAIAHGLLVLASPEDRAVVSWEIEAVLGLRSVHDATEGEDDDPDAPDAAAAEQARIALMNAALPDREPRPDAASEPPSALDANAQVEARLRMVFAALARLVAGDRDRA